jgi:lysophospholipase L1-like esterase
LAIPAIPAQGAPWLTYATALDAEARTIVDKIGKWKPNTAYTAGDPVVNPSGQLVTANTTFTSGATYSAANWTVTAGGGGGGGATLTPTATKTATYTAAVGDLAMMNVAGGATTLTLPTAPADKSQVAYRAIGATAAVPLVINRGGSTDTIGTAGATSASIPLAEEVTVLQYDAANTRWLAIANVKTQASLDAIYNKRPTSSSLPGYFVDAYAGLASAATAMSGAFTSPSTVVQNHQIALDCSDLRVVLPYGWYLGATQTVTDTIMPNSTTVKVSIQYNGATWPVTFQGKRQPTCDPGGGRLISDPIGGYWAKGTQLKLRVLITTITPSTYWVGKPATGPGINPAFTDNGFTVNADIVDATTAAGTANAADTLWGGHLIGQPTVMKPFVLGAVGDSITDGTGDTGGNGYAWISRATNATVPLFRAARGSVTAQGVAAVGYSSMAMLSGCSHTVVLLGTNDCGFNRTYAQLTADLTKIYQGAAAQGTKVIGATILPRTTSTDAWATTGNQSIPAGIGYTGGASSVRSQVNTWIRGGAGGLLAGYVETADTVETARDSGIWKATYTTDGIHPATVGHTAMAAAVNLATIAAL